MNKIRSFLRATTFGMIAGVLALGVVGGIALAQIVVPQQPTIGPSDLIQIVPNGQPQPNSVYVHPQQIAGAPGYDNLGAITTGNTYVFGNSTVYMFAQPSGTLAAVTLTTAPNPSDGQRECFLSTQTTTALTWNANTGQSISGEPTAGVADTPACMTYVLSAQTWYRS